MMADGGFSVEGSENIQELNWDFAHQISLDFHYSLSNKDQSVHIFTVSYGFYVLTLQFITASLFDALFLRCIYIVVMNV